jgi:hypothetical protein
LTSNFPGGLSRYNKLMLLRLLPFCAIALTLSAADISGIWNGQLTDRNGDVQDVSFRFVQTADSLTGKMYGDNKSTKIEDARIDGNQITFSVPAELNGQITKSVYSGTINLGGPNGDEMHLTRQRAGANPAGVAKGKGQNFRQSITLRRVA